MSLHSNLLGYGIYASLGKFFQGSGLVVYNQGQYNLVFADDDDTRQEKLALLRKLLDNLYLNLQPVIQDLQSPTSSPAYDTFFHDETSKPFLTALFTNITAGAVTYPVRDPPQFWVRLSTTAAPSLWSISRRGQMSAVGEDGVLQDMYDRCTSAATTTAFNMFTPKDPHPIIVLCPFFYDATTTSVFGDIPPASVDGSAASNCLVASPRTNIFRRRVPSSSPVGFELIEYRMWILLEELVHKYYNVATGLADEIDTYNVNAAKSLSAKDALANGPSYVYYAASIAGNCKSFPQSTRSGNRDEFRKLLTDDFPANVPEEDDDPADAAVSGETIVASRVEIDATDVVLGT
ncbi:MAG: hypothetical protein Q9186_004751 [Xanthomendoza sp. 1 TL-2023]